ncbi:MAG: VWA domain-containing protein [Planctomycetes bacterium]|nr:VWA domain-containing protein [Planctomycetota bacterium]
MERHFRIAILLLLAARVAGTAADASLKADDVAMLAERLKSPNDKEKVSALYDASKNGAAPALRLILPFITNSNSYISDRAIAAFSQTKDEAAFLAVAKEALASQDVKIKKGALEALARSWLKIPAEAAAAFLNDSDEETALLALEVYIQHPPSKAPAELLKLAASAKAPARARGNALLALAKCDPSAAGAAVAAASKDKDPLVRVGALVAGESSNGNPDAAVAALDDTDRRVRIAALEWLQKACPGAAVPKLILHLDKEAGRLKAMSVQTLKIITLRDFGADAAAWKNWYDQAGPNYSPPAADPAKAGKKPDAAPDPEETRAAGPRYYDFIVQSDRVAFVVDVSGSMREKYLSPGATSAGSGGDKSKLEHAAEALRDVLKQLPKGTRVSIIIFNTEPLRYQKGSKQNTARSIESSPELADEVYKFVIATGAKNKTNVNDSLELVLDDSEIDTVYLLTDGAPSAGRRNLGSRITEWATRVARLSKTQVNTIGFAAKNKDAEFLKNLAEATGGRYDSK